MSSFGPESITFFTQASPNGHSIAVALEELGLKYNVKPLDFSKKEQKEAWYLKICPNGRIPAIQDHNRGSFNVFESIAILLYLAQHYDPDNKISFSPTKEPDLYSEQVQWLAWAQGGLGPMQGQSNYFVRYSYDKVDSAIDRYRNESRRLYDIIEDRLSRSDWLVGNRYSLADIKAFTWVRVAAWADVCDLEFTGYPNIKAWIERCEARPATARGLNTPAPYPLRQMLDNIDATVAMGREMFLKKD